MKRRIILSVGFMLVLSVLFTSCITDLLFSSATTAVDNAIYDGIYGDSEEKGPRNPTGQVTNLTKSDVENFIKNYYAIESFLNPNEKDFNYGMNMSEDFIATSLNDYGISGSNSPMKYEMIMDCYSVLYEEILDENAYAAAQKGTANDPYAETRKAIAAIKKRTNPTDMAVVKPFRDTLASMVTPNFYY